MRVLFAFRSWVCATALLGLWALPVFAGSTDTAADLVPQDSAFFATTLKLRTQFEAVANSRAVQNILALPKVQAAIEQFKSQDEYQQFAAWKESELGQDLIALVQDLFHEECFIYGDSSWYALGEILPEYNQQLLQVYMQALMTQSEPKMGNLLIDLALNNPEVTFPGLVFGFKLDNQERLRGLLEQLQELIKQVPIDLAPKFEKIGKGEYLTVTISGKLIEDQREAILEGLVDADISETKAEKFLDYLSEKEVVFALGTYKNYALFTMTGDRSTLATLGSGGSLSNHPDMQVLSRHKDKELVSIAYASKKLNNIGVQRPAEMKTQLLAAMGFLAFVLPPAVAEGLQNDVSGLIDDADAAFVEPSAAIELGFLNQGYEGFSYNQSPGQFLSYSKPLKLFSSLGTDPFLAFSMQSTSALRTYDKAAKLSQNLLGYAKDFLENQNNEEGLEMMEQFEDKFLPYIKKFHSITRNKLLPATDANQSLFLMDFKMEFGGVETNPLPDTLNLPEFALAVTLKDAELFKEAIRDYVSLYENLAPQINEMNSEVELQETLRRPFSEQMGEGTTYYYDLPGVIGELSPHAYVQSDLFVLSLSKNLTQRMLSGDSFDGGKVMNFQRPSGIAFLVRPPAFWKAVREYIEFSKIIPGNPLVTDDPDQQEEMDQIIHTVISALETNRELSAQLYIDGDYQILHTWFHFEDVPADDN